MQIPTSAHIPGSGGDYIDRCITTPVSFFIMETEVTSVKYLNNHLLYGLPLPTLCPLLSVFNIDPCNVMQSAYCVILPALLQQMF